jgi:hypothetical protein
MRPQARQDQLLMREVGDELVVYDQERHRAHRLNRTAALVWRHCDGQTTVAELAELLHHEFNLPANEEVIWLALDRLEKAHLLQERLPRSTKAAGVSRRQVMRRLGRTAAVALLPVVATLVAPTPAMAQTVQPGQAQCCRYAPAVQGGTCGTQTRCFSNQQCVPNDPNGRQGCPAPASGCKWDSCTNVTSCSGC